MRCELKPCPFCNARTLKLSEHSNGCYLKREYYQICGFDSKQEREISWDTRADDWISIKERLPEVPEGKYDIEIIATTKNNRVFGCYYDKEGVFLDGKEESDDWITHWQYLPAPKGVPDESK